MFKVVAVSDRAKVLNERFEDEALALGVFNDLVLSESQHFVGLYELGLSWILRQSYLNIVEMGPRLLFQAEASDA